MVAVVAAVFIDSSKTTILRECRHHGLLVLKQQELSLTSPQFLQRPPIIILRECRHHGLLVLRECRHNAHFIVTV